MVKASVSGEAECFSQAEILEGLQLGRRQFQQMCIAAGCDYPKNVTVIGIHRAYDSVKKSNLMGSLADEEHLRSIKIVSTKLRQFSNIRLCLI